MFGFHDKIEDLTKLVANNTIPGTHITSPPGTGKLFKVLETLRENEIDHIELRVGVAVANDPYWARALILHINAYRFLGKIVVLDLDGVDYRSEQTYLFFHLMVNMLTQHGGFILVGQHDQGLPIQLSNRLVHLQG